mmetsp:Transcript_33346/g.51113  ORF Transcript_33346/g.51113 Transcript_33346/m.51113 type:complete len:89 (+) Transcript_33346:96-362(+)
MVGEWFAVERDKDEQWWSFRNCLSLSFSALSESQLLLEKDFRRKILLAKSSDRSTVDFSGSADGVELQPRSRSPFRVLDTDYSSYALL